MTIPIFLVEDDEVLRKQLIEAIHLSCDAEVIATADNEADAVSWLQSHMRLWELTVLDLFLLQGTGFGVLESLSDSAMRHRVIVLTNSATSENRSHCLRLGALAVYDKTSELDQFLDHCTRYEQHEEHSASWL
jgi:DNA-binding NarL/FixJ family response regulator